jgi:PilZ domain
VKANEARFKVTENRKFARRNIDLIVEIETSDGSILRGVLLDLSQGGARLKVDNPDSLPEQFMLKLSDKLHRRSRIAWRSAEEIGVELLSAPKALADNFASRSVLIKCPKTGRNISTGIRLTAADDLSKLSEVRRFTQCPSCKVVHGWTPNDASLGTQGAGLVHP